MSASGRSDYHCKIKEVLFTQEFNPTINLTSDSLCYFKSHPDLSLFVLYLNSFSKNAFENVCCNIRRARSDYLKCIASHCLSPPCVLFFL